MQDTCATGRVARGGKELGFIVKRVNCPLAMSWTSARTRDGILVM